jgi:hypothetical protein
MKMFAPFLNSIHWSGKGHDISALLAAAVATLSVHAVGEWLQVGVLFFTIIFLVLGIVMRWQKLKLGIVAEVDKEDEPILKVGEPIDPPKRRRD